MVEWRFAHRVLSINIAMVLNQQSGYFYKIALGTDMERRLPELVVLEDEEPVIGDEVSDVCELVALHRAEEFFRAFPAVDISRDYISTVISSSDPVVYDSAGDTKECLDSPVMKIITCTFEGSFLAGIAPCFVLQQVHLLNDFPGASIWPARNFELHLAHDQLNFLCVIWDVELERGAFFAVLFANLGDAFFQIAQSVCNCELLHLESPQAVINQLHLLQLQLLVLRVQLCFPLLHRILCLPRLLCLQWSHLHNRTLTVEDLILRNQALLNHHSGRSQFQPPIMRCLLESTKTRVRHSAP